MMTIPNQERFELKLKAGNYYIPVQFIVSGNKLRLNFPYNKSLLDVVKLQFEGRRWLGTDDTKPKMWEIPITPRNLFRLEFLQGKYSSSNPYQRFDDAEKIDLRPQITEHINKRKIKTKIYSHQFDLVNNGLATQWFIWGASPGVGKTLSSIITMEMTGIPDWFYVGPRSALASVRLEFEKWGSSIRPTFLTYEGLRDLVASWPVGKKPPHGVIFDEASKLKNPVAKRTVAAKHLADSMRIDHNYDCYIGLMTGTPAPKSPADWFSLCEIACPGFLKEGSLKAFRARLAIIEQRETVPGAGSYEHILCWKDDANRCKTCGELTKEHPNHIADGYLYGATTPYHQYEKSENEVAKLKTSMRGLVTIKLAEDCLDLPEQRFKEIVCKPSRATLNAAQIITESSRRAIEALTLLRELSDGFQYVEVPTGEKERCGVCEGVGKIINYINEADPSHILDDDEIKENVRYVWSQCSDEDDSDLFIPEIIDKIPIKIVEEAEVCPCCKGKKLVDVMKREVKEVPCPKEQVLIDLLEENEEVGRINIYGAFAGSIDRIIRICQKQKWAVLRMDGRGVKMLDGEGNAVSGTMDDLLKIYMYGQEQYEHLAFVGQPSSAGMGLQLTAAHVTVFYSNDFNAESRIQTEKRNHRIGMDIVRGGVICDILHLPSDRKVLENLRKKKELQHMTMKGLRDVFSSDNLHSS